MAFEARSRDGTVKHLWRLRDGEQVESGSHSVDGNGSPCASLRRPGAPWRAGSVPPATSGSGGSSARRRSSRSFGTPNACPASRFGRGISNVVYMGMGEPMANLDAVLASLSVLHGGFGFGARRITVSTVGLVPGIRALAARPEPFRLAVSLHSPEHALRQMLVPVEKRYPLPGAVRGPARVPGGQGPADHLRVYYHRTGQRLARS